MPKSHQHHFLLTKYTSYVSDIWYILTFKSICIMEVWNGNENCKNFLLIWTFDNFCAKTNFGVRNQTSVRSWPKFGNPRKHLISESLSGINISIPRKYIFKLHSFPLSFCRLYSTKTKRAKLFVWKLPWPGDSKARLATKLISSI